MIKKFHLYIAIGIIAIGLSIKCFSCGKLDYEMEHWYGGNNAITDTAKATAVISKNTKEIASIVHFGFGSVLLVSGLGFLATGLITPIEKKNKKDK